MLIFRTQTSATLMALLCLLCFLGCEKAAKVQVTDAWTRPMSEGQSGAIYLTISNSGNVDDWLLLPPKSDVAFEIFPRNVSISPEGKVTEMRMQGEGQYKIRAGGTVQFGPNGMHLWMADIKRTLHVGEHFSLVLRFQQTGTINVDVTVQDRQ